MSNSRVVPAGGFVALMVLLTFGGASPAVAADGESSGSTSEATSATSDEAESTDTSSSKATASSRPSPPRGKLGAEIGGSFAGLGAGALGLGLITMGVGSAIIQSEEAAFPPEFTVGITGAVLGGFAFTGTGAGLAGNWTGGNGRVGWAMVGSTVGGIGGVAIPIGLGAVIGGATNSDVPRLIGYVSGALFGLGGASIGGVLGYRMSAESVSGKSASAGATIRPFAAPNFDGGGNAGVSVSF